MLSESIQKARSADTRLAVMRCFDDIETRLAYANSALDAEAAKQVLVQLKISVDRMIK